MADSQARAGCGQAITRGRIQAILFDLDDTLISWERPTVSREDFYFPRIEKIHTYLTGAGYLLPPCPEFWEAIDQAIMAMWAEARQTWRIIPLGRLMSKLLRDLGLNLDHLDTDQLLKLLDWAPRPGVELFPETLPVLLSLR
ncbi:MAG: hypothetical protein PVJ75_17570, partial [Chloroflexota bacterium]